MLGTDLIDVFCDDGVLWTKPSRGGAGDNTYFFVDCTDVTNPLHTGRTVRQKIYNAVMQITNDGAPVNIAPQGCIAQTQPGSALETYNCRLTSLFELAQPDFSASIWIHSGTHADAGSTFNSVNNNAHGWTGGNLTYAQTTISGNRHDNSQIVWRIQNVLGVTVANGKWSAGNWTATLTSCTVSADMGVAISYAPVTLATDHATTQVVTLVNSTVTSNATTITNTISTTNPNQLTMTGGTLSGALRTTGKAALTLTPALWTNDQANFTDFQHSSGAVVVAATSTHITGASSAEGDTISCDSTGGTISISLGTVTIDGDTQAVYIGSGAATFHDTTINAPNAQAFSPIFLDADGLTLLSVNIQTGHATPCIASTDPHSLHATALVYNNAPAGTVTVLP